MHSFAVKIKLSNLDHLSNEDFYHTYQFTKASILFWSILNLFLIVGIIVGYTLVAFYGRIYFLIPAIFCTLLMFPLIFSLIRYLRPLQLEVLEENNKRYLKQRKQGLLHSRFRRVYIFAYIAIIFISIGLIIMILVWFEDPWIVTPDKIIIFILLSIMVLYVYPIQIYLIHPYFRKKE